MSSLIDDFFERDLSADEEARLKRMLEASEEDALAFSRSAERRYKALGLTAASLLVALGAQGKGGLGAWLGKGITALQLAGAKAVLGTALVMTVAAGGYWALHPRAAAPAPAAVGDGLAIELSLTTARTLSVTVFDARGALVRDFGERSYPAGEQTLYWDGLDDRSQAVQPGRYRVLVRTATGTAMERWLEVR